MPRGGPRPNSGRPRKVATAKAAVIAVAEKALPVEQKPLPSLGGKSPLEFLLGVMRDEDAQMTDRFRAAIAAAPYVHPKAEAAGDGVKKKRQAAADDHATNGRFATRSGPRLVANN